MSPDPTPPGSAIGARRPGVRRPGVRRPGARRPRPFGGIRAALRLATAAPSRLGHPRTVRPLTHGVVLPLLLSLTHGVVLPLLLSLVLPLVAGCGEKGERRASDLPYIPVDKAFQPLRRDFEEAGGKVRLVGLVSPTCGDCLDMAEALDARLLPAVPSEDFEVFLVWVKAIPPDVEPRVRELTEKYANPRIRHYWDGSGRIARAFARHVGLTEGTHAYAIFYLYGRGDTWDPQGTMAKDPPDYNAVLDGWQPSDPRARQGAHPMIRLPQLNVDTMKPLVEGLLAEPDPLAKPR